MLPYLKATNMYNICAFSYLFRTSEFHGYSLKQGERKPGQTFHVQCLVSLQMLIGMITCLITHHLLASFSYPSPLSTLPGIAWHINGLHSNPYLRICFWGAPINTPAIYNIHPTIHPSIPPTDQPTIHPLNLTNLSYAWKYRRYSG